MPRSVNKRVKKQVAALWRYHFRNVCYNGMNVFVTKLYEIRQRSRVSIPVAPPPLYFKTAISWATIP